METNENLPLEGIKVLELGHTVMGPTCGLVLADMGADGSKDSVPVFSLISTATKKAFPSI